MGYKSAKNGTGTWNGTTLNDLTDIQISEDAGVQRHSTSSTAGKYRRNAGATDKSGTFTMMCDDVPFAIGDEGTLVLKSDSSTTLFNDLVFIENIQYRVPIDGGGNVQAVVTWGRTVA